jgi:AAHS family 4-hydroxybenzoate transporter-like MFS transporter
MAINPTVDGGVPTPARSDLPVEPGELIDRRPMSVTQLMVVVLCAAAVFVDGYDIQVMALAVPSLSAGWSLPPSSFGLALSAVVIGMSVGSAFLAPLGDRVGRRTMVIATLAAIGIATACTSLSTSPFEFAVWRFLTGIALGAGVPNCAALTSEYAPVANRSFVMGCLNIAAPIGAFSGGFIAPPVLEAFGWRGAFLIGGAAPLVFAVLAAFLPESLKFLTARRPSDPRIATIVRRIAPDVDPAMVRAAPAPEKQRGSLFGPLTAAFRQRTLLLWGMLILNFFNLYVLISWLPLLLEQSGWSSAAALRGAVLIQAGGVVGGLLMSRFMDRGATRVALVAGLLLSAASLLLFSAMPAGAAWVALLLLTGAGVSGSQLVLNALSAAYYPPVMKATGVAWALVIGNFGAMAGPLAGGWLIDQHLSPVTILALLAIPAVVCASGVALVRKEWQAH